MINLIAKIFMVLSIIGMAATTLTFFVSSIYFWQSMPFASALWEGIVTAATVAGISFLSFIISTAIGVATEK